jgi:O-succinylhomoserine sulfhydrylase
MLDKEELQKLALQTQSIRTVLPHSAEQEHSSAIYLTSSFKFNSAEQAAARFNKSEPGNIYGRYTNPNTNEFIAKVCSLEKAEAGIATASGMAAIFTCFSALLQQGDHIINSNALFGPTYKILDKQLPKWGIEVDYAPIDDFDNWQQLFKPNTKVFYIETPSNPALALIDIKKLAQLCKSRGVILIVDNAFASPIVQQPLLMGADLVIHSATKYMDGQGRILGGVIVGNQALIDQIADFARFTGSTLSAFNSWILSKSLETLQLRVEKHCDNAWQIAQALENTASIEAVRYPFLESHPQYELAKRQMSHGGAIITLFLKGGQTQAFQFINAVKIFSITANLGDAKSTITHPATTTHSSLAPEQQQQIGITPNMVRLSIGLEDATDLIADIKQAIAVIG